MAQTHLNVFFVPGLRLMSLAHSAGRLVSKPRLCLF